MQNTNISYFYGMAKMPVH